MPLPATPTLPLKSEQTHTPTSHPELFTVMYTHPLNLTAELLFLSSFFLLIVALFPLCSGSLLYRYTFRHHYASLIIFFYYQNVFILLSSCSPSLFLSYFYSLFVIFLNLQSRITYVQSTPGVPSTLPLVSTTTGSSTTQQALPVAGSAYVPSALATLGFTAIAPPGQALVQPLITGQCN